MPWNNIHVWTVDGVNKSLVRKSLLNIEHFTSSISTACWIMATDYVPLKRLKWRLCLFVSIETKTMWACAMIEVWVKIFLYFLFFWRPPQSYKNLNENYSMNIIKKKVLKTEVSVNEHRAKLSLKCGSSMLIGGKSQRQLTNYSILYVFHIL